MSHFSLLVLVNKNVSKKTEKELEEIVTPLVERFVPEHIEWWVIGGRWHGVLGNWDPETDPRNWETCDLCKGTGTRTTWPASVDEAWRQGCNGCESKGKRLKWHSQWVIPLGANVARVRDLLMGERWKSFAIITPDGKWHAQGEMLMFACVDKDKGGDTWHQEARALLEDHTESYAIMVDCHQ